MANQEHLNLLRSGVDHWNTWIRSNSDVRPDLSDAPLREADLSGANLDKAVIEPAMEKLD